MPGAVEVFWRVRWPDTLLFVSLWDGMDAVARFNAAVPEHVVAVTRLWREGGASWSGLYELVGPSAQSVGRDGIVTSPWPQFHTDTVGKGRAS